MGFFNEADTLESSLILFYSTSECSIYTKNEWSKAMLIKDKFKRWQLVEEGIVASLQTLIKGI